MDKEEVDGSWMCVQVPSTAKADVNGNPGVKLVASNITLQFEHIIVALRGYSVHDNNSVIIHSVFYQGRLSGEDASTSPWWQGTARPFAVSAYGAPGSRTRKSKDNLSPACISTYLTLCSNRYYSRRNHVYLKSFTKSLSCPYLGVSGRRSRTFDIGASSPKPTAACTGLVLFLVHTQVVLLVASSIQCMGTWI